MSAKAERRLWFAYHRLYLVPEDLLAIGHALKRELPDVMFRPANDDEWYELSGGQSWIAGRLIDSGKPIRCVPKPRLEWQAKLSPEPEALLHGYKAYGWLLPRGWEAEWGVSTDGRPYIANPPDLAFVCERSMFRSSRIGLTCMTAPAIEAESEFVELSSGRFGGGCWPWEEEKRHFLRRCKTIVRRHTTARFAVFDNESHRITQLIEKESPRDTRFGFHALEWARAHPRHYIDRYQIKACIKPVDWTAPQRRTS